MRSLLLAALLAASLHAVPASAEGALTLSQAQRLAVERSRALEGRRHAVEAARERAVAAGELPDPVLSLGIENVPLEGADKFRVAAEGMTMKRVAVMQTLTRGEKRRLRAERFDREARRGLAEHDATLAQIQRDAALAWLDAWYAEAMAGVVAEQRVRALQESQAAEAQYRAGRGSQPDVLMAHASLALLDDRAAEQERRVRTARTMLARWTGDDAPVALGPRPDIGEMSLQAHALDETLGSHPEIEALTRAQEVAATEARLARAERRPDWTVEAAYGERASRFGDMFSIGVSIPLPWDRANRQDREVAARLAEAADAEARRDEALRQHVAEVRAMVQEWESNRARLARFEREIVPLATARAAAAEAAYRGARASQTDVLAARRAELDARLQALQLEAETARLWARLTFLIPGETK